MREQVYCDAFSSASDLCLPSCFLRLPRCQVKHSKIARYPALNYADRQERSKLRPSWDDLQVSKALGPLDDGWFLGRMGGQLIITNCCEEVRW